MADKDTGIVSIHGKQYKTVALRISEFRETHPTYGIITKLVSADDEAVVVKATIIAEGHERFPLATGYAEERRSASQINKTSALENAETSAVGRALAFLGYAGSEIASADEVANAIGQQNAEQAVQRWLKPGGVFVVKIFQGEGIEDWMRNMRKKFGRFKLVKPRASRPDSREMYAVAESFRQSFRQSLRQGGEKDG